MYDNASIILQEEEHPNNEKAMKYQYAIYVCISLSSYTTTNNQLNAILHCQQKYLTIFKITSKNTLPLSSFSKNPATDQGLVLPSKEIVYADTKPNCLSATRRFQIISCRKQVSQILADMSLNNRWKQNCIGYIASE